MSSPAARERADLQARTGIDFTRYVDDELVDSVTGWSGLLGVVKELAFSLAIGLAVILAAVVAAVVRPEATAGFLIGGVVGAVGATAATFGLRLRRRIPAEASKVFEVAAAAADRVGEDIAAGRLTISAADAARGVTLVAAIPALTRAARRRFPLLGTVAAPAVGAVLGRALARLWPSGQGTAPLTGMERPARRLQEVVAQVGESVVPRVRTAVRWATLPLAAGGVVLIILGAGVLFVSFSQV